MGFTREKVVKQSTGLCVRNRFQNQFLGEVIKADGEKVVDWPE